MTRSRLSIAILGTRGIPAGYGGFETFAEQLSLRMAARGHDVTVYCRGWPAGRPSTWKGVRLVHLPAIRNKYAETLTHTFWSALHAALRSYDIVYVCNSANSPVCYIPAVRRQRVVLNVDGLEWRRAKWGKTARRYYRWASRLAARMPIEVVTDADTIQEYYRRHYDRETRVFRYGTDRYERGYLESRLDALGLQRDRYLLYVSRLEPENNALLVVQAYGQVETDVPLVIVGDAPYAHDYVSQVRRAADERVRFLGFRFGDDYHALQANALAYVQATEVGGTHPALVEAMGHGNAILAHDVPEHHEVLADAGRYFERGSVASLARELRAVLDSEELVADLRAAAADRVTRRYDWERIVDDYETYFHELVGGRQGDPGQ